jgi:hypothetical protein
MSKEEYIRDFNTRQIIGILRTLNNGDVEAREFSSRKILGFYRAKKNTTTDFYGKMLTKGNAAAGLIYDAFQKKKAKR